MEQRPSIWLDQSGRAWLNMNAILKKTTRGCRNVNLTVLLERFYLLCDVNLFFEFNMMFIPPVKPHLITSNTLTTFDCSEFRSSVPSLVRRRDNKTNNQSWRSTLLTTMKSHNASKNKLYTCRREKKTDKRNQLILTIVRVIYAFMARYSL